MDEQLRWKIPTRNAAGEDGSVSVLVMGDRVVVVLPPGETLIFEPDQADALAAVLDEASPPGGS